MMISDKKEKKKKSKLWFFLLLHVNAAYRLYLIYFQIILGTLVMTKRR